MRPAPLRVALARAGERLGANPPRILAGALAHRLVEALICVGLVALVGASRTMPQISLAAGLGAVGIWAALGPLPIVRAASPTPPPILALVKVLLARGLLVAAPVVAIPLLVMAAVPRTSGPAAVGLVLLAALTALAGATVAQVVRARLAPAPWLAGAGTVGALREAWRRTDRGRSYLMLQVALLAISFILAGVAVSAVGPWDAARVTSAPWRELWRAELGALALWRLLGAPLLVIETLVAATELDSTEASIPDRRPP